MTIIVNAAELNAIKSIAISQATLAKLGSFEGKQASIDNLKKAKKAWWATIRMRHGLPSSKGSKRLAIELDGDRVGELRYKAKSPAEKADIAGRVVQAHAQAQGSAANNGNGSITPAEAAAAVQRALEAAGVPFEVRVKGNGAANDGSHPVSYAA